nr:RluA family pseudouridine synthase [Bdellovibrio sp. CKG001]
MQSARGFEYGVRHILSPQSGGLCDVLLSNLELDREQIQFLLQLGAIYHNHQRVTENSSVSSGDYIRVHTKPRRFPANDGQWLSRLVFQNEHFLVVNKTSGLPVHASVDNLHENLQSYLQQTLQQNIYVTHRLDVPTRGLIVYAKTAEFQTEFNKLLIQRELRKVYRARVQGQDLSTGLLRHFMEPSPRAPKVVSKEAQPKWQECLLEILEFSKLENNQGLAKIKLHTGRTHQIRAQLGAEGHPIVGDFAYGAEKLWEEERIELEACELAFTNPLTGESHEFKI